MPRAPASPRSPAPRSPWKSRAPSPTAVVAASRDADVAKQVQELFHRAAFRVYTSTDLIGVELGGALKNVVAIAAGVGDGLGFGDNSKAALLTRGIVEIRRLGVANGAQAETFAGLSGPRDLGHLPHPAHWSRC